MNLKTSLGPVKGRKATFWVVPEMGGKVASVRRLLGPLRKHTTKWTGVESVAGPPRYVDREPYPWSGHYVYPPPETVPVDFKLVSWSGGKVLGFVKKRLSAPLEIPRSEAYEMLKKPSLRRRHGEPASMWEDDDAY